MGDLVDALQFAHPSPRSTADAYPAIAEQGVRVFKIAAAHDCWDAGGQADISRFLGSATYTLRMSALLDSGSLFNSSRLRAATPAAYGSR
jgi:hypothetical protein